MKRNRRLRSDGKLGFLGDGTERRRGIRINKDLNTVYEEENEKVWRVGGLFVGWSDLLLMEGSGKIKSVIWTYYDENKYTFVIR